MERCHVKNHPSIVQFRSQIFEMTTITGDRHRRQLPFPESRSVLVHPNSTQQTVPRWDKVECIRMDRQEEDLVSGQVQGMDLVKVRPWDKEVQSVLVSLTAWTQTGRRGQIQDQAAGALQCRRRRVVDRQCEVKLYHRSHTPLELSTPTLFPLILCLFVPV